ncbi:MAG: ATP-dependent endonuclease [Thermoguttaceae bacterium]
MFDFPKSFVRLLSRWRARPDPVPPILSQEPAPAEKRVLVVVEGKNDIEFLRRASAILHLDDPRLPDLAAWERQGRILFVPFGGELVPWALYLARLDLPTFGLFDREMPPATEGRRQWTEVVNLRPACVARLTLKRTLENYLDPSAIREALGIEVRFSDDDNVADMAARAIYARQGKPGPWESLPPRSRKRRRDRVKTLLNTAAVERMTLARLAERDPGGEIRSWLATIARLASPSP